MPLGTFDQETIDVATDIFENNDIGQNDLGEVTIKPIEPEQQGPSSSFESVEMEMNTEMGWHRMKMDMDMPPPPMEVQISKQNVEVEIEMEMKNDITDDGPLPVDPIPNQNQVRKVEPVSPKQKSKNQNQDLDRNLTNLSQQRKRGQIVNLLV